MLLVFLVAVLLRLGMTLWNRESNDDHITPIRLIMLTNKLPKGGRSVESYQPKLYHYTVAKLARLIGVSPSDENGLILTAQGINFVAGVLIVAVTWLFVSQLPIEDPRLKIWTFSLAALNPSLIGISAQATNDTFVILFSVLAVFLAYRFLTSNARLAIVLACLCGSLAIVSKTNGWVTIAAIFGALVVRAISQRRSMEAWAIALAFPVAAGILTFFNPLSQYEYNLQHYGSPTLINMQRAPAPGLFTKTEYPIGGIASIQDGFFTFKFLDLLKVPYSLNSPDGTDTEPSSFWTTLYARSQSVHFDLFPRTWAQRDVLISTLSRLLFIAALAPILLTLLGAFIEARRLASALLGKSPDGLPGASYGLMLFLFCGYIGFLMLYTYEYRTATVIKSIFVLPGLLSIVTFFPKGAEGFISFVRRIRPWLVHLLDADLAILVALYVLEISLVILKLYSTPGPIP